MVLSLMLRSLVHFEFAFNWKVPRIEVPCFPYCVISPSTILFKDTILPVGLSWHCIWKVPELIGVALFLGLIRVWIIPRQPPNCVSAAVVL